MWSARATGFFATIPDFLDSQHKVETAEDAEAYLSRLRPSPRAWTARTSGWSATPRSGSVAPDFLLDTTLKQQFDYRAQPVAEWGLVTSVARRAKAHAIAGDWAERARKICEAEVAPALDRQIDTLKGLRAKATQMRGLEAAGRRGLLPLAARGGDHHHHDAGRGPPAGPGADPLDWGGDGRAAEEAGPDAGHGRRADDRARQGPAVPVPEHRCGARPALGVPERADRRDAARLPQAFGIIHKADLVIKRVPPVIEAGAPDGYEQDGPIDGSRPATYYINLKDTSNWPKFSLPTLSFHEGLPGHVWQGTFAHDLPTIRSQLLFNAYVEGWALYAEQLADELGMYADDPIGRLGYLQSIQFRACRLVVDTGLHAMRWTREQAIQWMVENNGNPVGLQRAARSTAIAPGPARPAATRSATCRSIACGARRRRRWARASTSGFNDAVLTSGSLPLTCSTA